ncbi:MAG: hypothetical protein OXC03_07575 [Flavobacteriaceae bacterium]|nr:hypothetical protein [Flavobacteriaceae bacterium]
MYILNRIPSDHVDCVITSPPYNMNLWIRNGQYCSCQMLKEFSTGYNGFADNLTYKPDFRVEIRPKRLLGLKKVPFSTVTLLETSFYDQCQ